MNRPNILLLCADMAGAANFGCYGDKTGLTPSIDRLAAAGITFDRAYCPNPPCIPTRVSMMSGLYGHTHGKVAHIKMDLEPKPALIPEYLSRNGYRTGLVGKTHWWPSTSTLGCDDAFITIDNHLTPELGKNDAYITYLESEGILSYNESTWGQDQKKLQPDSLPFEKLKVNWTGRQACELLELYAKDAVPFFLFCSFVEPHGAGKAPKDYLEEIKDLEFPPVIGRDGEHDNKPWIQREAVKRWAKSREEIDGYRQGVYGGIGLVDQNIGKILDTVDALNIAENTVILFLTDHGDLMYDHGCIEKTFLYEQAIRIPFLLSGPGLPAGERRNNLVSQIDLLPTVLDLCSNDSNSLQIDGRSLMPIVENPDAEWRDTLYAEVDQTFHLKQLVSSAQAKMARSGPWKYIYTLVDGHVVEEELYNLDVDPHELYNLADDLLNHHY